MKKRKKAIVTLILFILFGLYTLAVSQIDVKAIGPQNSSVGFASINSFMLKHLGTHLVWYDITDWLGIAALLTGGIFALIGLVQLIRRRSLFKVDSDILLLGGFYLLTLGFYVLFEVCVINYRPIILEEGLEASYPSSHTLLVICIMATAILQINWRVKVKSIRTGLVILAAAVLLVTIVGRMISGVHWFSDICGAMLLGSALVSLYSFLTELVRRE